MKKLIIAILSVSMLFSVAAADLPDISGLSFDELVTLREQLNLAIWNSQEWQEVSVPEGTYIVGRDIPAGHWSLRAENPKAYFYVSVFDHTDATGKGPENCSFYWDQDLYGKSHPNPFSDDMVFETDIELRDGWYFRTTGTVVFSPFTGKPDLGFH